MWQAKAGVCMLLCIASLFVSAAGCATDGPDSCFFEKQGSGPTLCNWLPGGHANLTQASNVWYLELSPGKDPANLTSRTACSTGGLTHCLRFDYRFDVNNVSEFSVSLDYDLSHKDELLRISSSSGGLSGARVPITTNDSFSVTLKAETLCGQNQNQGSVRIYNIRYENISCTLQLPAGSPASTAATPSSYNMSSSSTSDGLQQTKSTQANTLSTTSSDGQDKHEESSDQLGIIVGVVVGVIILMIVAMLLLVLLRRKRRHSSNTNNTPENSGQHRPNTALSTQLSDNCSTMRSSGDPQPSAESEIPEYAVANKQRKKKHENPSQSPFENCDHDAQNLHQNSESERAQEQGQDRDCISSTTTNPDPMIASGSSVYQVPRGDTTTKSEDQGVEYNALEFEGQRSFSDKRTAEETFEDGAGTVYNHLNDGDEDAYNEVDRHNKALGFSEEYSHIQ